MEGNGQGPGDEGKSRKEPPRNGCISYTWIELSRSPDGAGDMEIRPDEGEGKSSSQVKDLRRL